MSRPVGFAQPPAAELHAGWIVTANAAGTTTYRLRSQPDRVRGPARYLRPASPAVASGNGPDAHVHDRPAPPPAGTPCLVVTLAGSLTDAWVIPFT